MDQRLRDVEGDIGRLKDWRVHTVDPWISGDGEFRRKVDEFITTLKAREELEDKLNEERHKSNTTKLNWIVALGSIFGVFVSIIGAIIAYAELIRSAVPH